MPLYTDQVMRLSTARLRVELGPRRWSEASTITLEADGWHSNVRLVDVPHPSAHGGTVRRVTCPDCGRPCATLALVPGKGFCCRRCGGWRSRV